MPKASAYLKCRKWRSNLRFKSECSFLGPFNSHFIKCVSKARYVFLECFCFIVISHIFIIVFFFKEVFTLNSSFFIFLDTVFQKIRYFDTFNLISFQWLKYNRHRHSENEKVNSANELTEFRTE